MPDQHPSTFCKNLTEENLQFVANVLLQVRDTVSESMQDPFDDNYTRECTAFGRSRNAIIAICQDQKLPQFSLQSSGMDFTFCIDDSMPIRVYKDDPNNPQKPGFFRQMSFLPINEQEVLCGRFVIEDLKIDGTEPCVYFIGYNNAFGEELFRWCSKESVSITGEIDESVPQSAPISDPALAKKDTQSQQKKNKEDN